jgi:hypothetical protein
VEAEFLDGLADAQRAQGALRAGRAEAGARVPARSWMTTLTSLTRMGSRWQHSR